MAAIDTTQSHHTTLLPNHVLRKIPVRKNSAAMATLSFKTPDVHNTTDGRKRNAITAAKEAFGRQDPITRTRDHAPRNERKE